MANKYKRVELAVKKRKARSTRTSPHAVLHKKPARVRALGAGTPAIHLQPKLLIFLLFRHGKEGEKVYNTIDSFMKTIWGDLKILDFVKTKTGVLRCVTNTRFAANTLRGYGLLKFTKKEAFKTWVLSLTGVMVAAKLLREGAWGQPIVMERYRAGLHPVIGKSYKALTKFDEFLATLTFITKPKTNLCEEFSTGTEITHRWLNQYHQVLKNNDLSSAEKKKECRRILTELENDTAVIDFYQKLVSSLKIGDLLSLK